MVLLGLTVGLVVVGWGELVWWMERVMLLGKTGVELCGFDPMVVR